MKSKAKLLCILGPTASGKSSCAVSLAKKFDGEVVSADSRQVYRGLDIATGKITEEEMQGIPHHLLDVADPQDSYTVTDFKRDASEAIEDVLSRDRLPIIAGGTGYYIQTVVDNITIPEVPPNKTLREKLHEQTSEALHKQLAEKDFNRSKEIHPNNKRRIIRALEIHDALGEIPDIDPTPPDDYTYSPYDVLQIGLDLPDGQLRSRIHQRTVERSNRGMFEEAQRLHNNGVPLERMRELGLEYAILADWLENNITKEAALERIETADWQYARKQRMWFARDKRIVWYNPQTDREHIPKHVAEWLDTR